jgi:hypothetical protein
MPALRHTSPIAVPSSAWRKMNATWASVKLDFFMLVLRSRPNPKLEFSSFVSPKNGKQVERAACSRHTDVFCTKETTTPWFG